MYLHQDCNDYHHWSLLYLLLQVYDIEWYWIINVNITEIDEGMLKEALFCVELSH